MIDPVYVDDSLDWWFWDETWVDSIGPFATEEEARRHLGRYVHWLGTGEVTGG